MLQDGLALLLAVSATNEMAVRQLLAELAVNPEEGYAKGVVLRTLAMVPQEARDWVRGLY